MNGRFVKFLAAAALGTATMFGTSITTVTYLNDPLGVNAPYVGKVAILGPNQVLLYCDDLADSVTGGESWSAYVTPLSAVIANVSATNVEFKSLTSGGLNVATSLYEQAAWLVYQFAGHAADNFVIQNAIWSLFNQTNGSVPGQTAGNTDMTTEGYWLYHAKTSYTTLSAAQINAFLVLTPTGAPQGLGMPQEFFAIAPEPGTYVLFGAGLILLSLGTFRRTRRKVN